MVCNIKTFIPKLSVSILALAIFGFASQASLAVTDNSPTLEKIKKNKVVVVGHRESSIPFSYYGHKQEVVGYSQDYSNLIIEKLKVELNEPNLRVKLLPITSQNRIPLLQNGTYDFECGSTTNNLSRQQQVGFSNTIFIIGTRFLVAKDSGIKDVTDLKGKNVAVTAGTTSEQRLQQINSEKDLNIKIIALKDHGDAFRTVEAGRAAAFLIDDALLAGERARAKQPEKWEIVGTPLSYEAYGCMVRKDDPVFKSFVDEAIATAQTSGEAAKLYNRWFTQPIPTRDLNLNFAMSEEMQALFKAPNDQALD